MIIFVMDASALVALLNNETGGNTVNTLLADTEAECLAHSINLCEVYYDALRASDRKTAEKALAALGALGLLERNDMDTAFWQLVGQLKVSPGRISLADCFVLALAIRTGGTLVTSDHEFDAVVPLDLCPILFIR